MKITDAERLRLARRRKRMTQNALAARFGMTARRASEWELSDDHEIPTRVASWARSVVSVPRTGEKAQVARRRAGKTIKQVARTLGCSHVHVIKMERGEAEASAYFAWLKEKYGV